MIDWLIDWLIQFSKKRARSRKVKEAQLEKVYASAKQIYENDACENNLNMLIMARENLESFFEQKARGIITRARARWHEFGEKSCKHFLDLEKRNHVKKRMRKLNIYISSSTDPKVSLAEEERFYQDLYTSGNKYLNNNSIETFLMSFRFYYDNLGTSCFVGRKPKQALRHEGKICVETRGSKNFNRKSNDYLTFLNADSWI